MKIAVIAYSFEGNTWKIASAIAESLHADLIRLVPQKEMTSTGFSKYIWGGRQVVFGTKPKIEPLSHDPNQYDLIFLGSPIWAGTYAPPVKTFLETGLVHDKPIAFFYTHEGGFKNAVTRAQKAIEPDNYLIGSLDLLQVMKYEEQRIQEAIAWAKSILKQHSNG